VVLSSVLYTTLFTNREMFEQGRSRPAPAYQKPPIDTKFYKSVADDETRTLIESFVIFPRSGRAWKVPAGHVFWLSTPEGPQVGDLNIWNFNNPRERFWAARTRQLQASHVSVGDRLWSVLPFLRPLCTIVKDSLAEYGIDKFGGRCHDLLGTRCDPYGGFGFLCDRSPSEQRQLTKLSQSTVC
jgi:uncharacterized protein YcgI (DUF1989 family)